jgi:hypothetical protein
VEVLPVINEKKVIISLLAELRNDDEEKKPHWDDYGISKEKFASIVDMMMDEGLIKNASISRGGIGNKAQAVFLNNARVTLKGLDYLQDNSALVKTYKGLKEIRDWLPF